MDTLPSSVDIRAERDMLRRALAAAGIGAWEIDVATGTVRWTDTLFRLLDADPRGETPSLEHTAQYVGAEARTKFAEAMKRAIDDGLPWDLEVPVVTAAGRRLRMRWRGGAERDAAGRITRLAGTCEDVTAAHRAREGSALQRVEQLEFAAASAGIGTYARDMTTGLGHWDSAAWRLFGLEPRPGAPDYNTVLAAVHPDDRERYLQVIHSPGKSDAPRELEIRVVLPDGAVRWLLIRGRSPDHDHSRRAGVVIDITARKLAEQQATEYAAWLRLTSSNVGIGLWQRDADSGDVYWDESMRRMLEAAPDAPALPPDDAVQLLVPEDRERARAFLAQTPAPGQVMETTVRLPRRDGDVRHVLLRRAAEYDEGGRVRRFYGAAFDVTETHRTAAELRVSKVRFEVASNVAEIGFFERPLDRGPGYWSEQMWRLYGEAPRAEPPTWQWLIERVVPEDRALVESLWSQLQRSSSYVETEFRVRRPDGSIAWLQSRARYEDRDGRPRVVGVTLDVTARRVAAMREREILNRLQLATGTVGIGLWHLDVDGVYSVWDAQTRRIFGLSDDAPVPSFEEYLEMVVPEDRPRVLATRARHPGEGEIVELEYRIRRRDGGVRHLLSRRVLAVAPDGVTQRVLGAVMDVTEAREAEARARAAAERLRLAVEAGRFASWERDLEHDSGYWDTLMFEFHGLTPTDWSPPLETVISRVHPDDRQAFLAGYERTRYADDPVEWEYRVLSHGDRVLNVLARARVERRPDGTPWRVIGATIDVTDSRRAQSERDALAARMQIVAHSLGLGIWDWDPVSRVSVWNDQMYELFGRDRDWFRDHAWIDAMHPDDRARATADFDHAVHHGDSFDEEFRVVHADGSVRWIATRGRVQRDANGRAVRLIGVNWDVTERRVAEEAARAAERRARELLERMQFTTSVAGLGMWEYDVATLESSMDDVVYALYGLTREEMPDLPRQWLSRVHPDDRERVRADAARMREGAADQETEFRIVRPDGSVRWLAGRAHRIVDAAGRERVLGVNWDITERRLAEDALQAKEVAERANRAKTEFLSRMSHELRTPLNAIIGFTQVLELDRNQPLTPVQRDRVEKIRQGGWHLLTLINEILDLSRIEAGEMKLAMAMVPLAPIVDECIALVSADAARRDIRLAQSQAAGAPHSVWADATRVKQVLLNLLSNAVKYNRDGGRVDVELSSDAAGRAVVCVRDTGHGMTPAQLAQLFQPFNRLGREHGGVEGTGIGLAISQKLAQQMGGEITASSEPGVGSAFRFVLEAASTGHDHSADVLQGIAGGATQRAAEVTGTVLYVEDNEANVAVVEELLSLRPGVKLFTAPDGATGRVLAGVCQPDLILLDMRLPDTDGPTLLGELRANPLTAAIPCVALSANALPGDAAQARALGFLDYWTKPIEAGPFLRGIDTLLARRERA